MKNAIFIPSSHLLNVMALTSFYMLPLLLFSFMDLIAQTNYGCLI